MQGCQRRLHFNSNWTLNRNTLQILWKHSNFIYIAARNFSPGYLPNCSVTGDVEHMFQAPRQKSSYRRQEKYTWKLLLQKYWCKPNRKIVACGSLECVGFPSKRYLSTFLFLIRDLTLSGTMHILCWIFKMNDWHRDLLIDVTY